MDAILAKPLRAEKSSPSVPPSLAKGVPLANLSANSHALNPPVENFLIECNGALYGFNPSIIDCERAAEAVSYDSEQMVWGDRHTVLPGNYYPLPFAVFGSKL